MKYIRGQKIDHYYNEYVDIYIYIFWGFVKCRASSELLNI